MNGIESCATAVVGLVLFSMGLLSHRGFSITQSVRIDGRTLTYLLVYSKLCVVTSVSSLLLKGRVCREIATQNHLFDEIFKKDFSVSVG